MLNRVKFLQIIRAITTGVSNALNPVPSPDLKPGPWKKKMELPQSKTAGEDGDMEIFQLEKVDGECNDKNNDKNNSCETKEEKTTQNSSSSSSTPPAIHALEVELTDLATVPTVATVATMSPRHRRSSSPSLSALSMDGMKKTQGSVVVGRSLMKRSMSDANRLDRVFLDCVKSVRELLDSKLAPLNELRRIDEEAHWCLLPPSFPTGDRATLWLIDYHNGVLWSKVAEGIPHIRVSLLFVFVMF